MPSQLDIDQARSDIAAGQPAKMKSALYQQAYTRELAHQRAQGTDPQTAEQQADIVGRQAEGTPPHALVYSPPSIDSTTGKFYRTPIDPISGQPLGDRLEVPNPYIGQLKPTEPALVAQDLFGDQFPPRTLPAQILNSLNPQQAAILNAEVQRRKVEQAGNVASAQAMAQGYDQTTPGGGTQHIVPSTPAAPPPISGTPAARAAGGVIVPNTGGGAPPAKATTAAPPAPAVQGRAGRTAQTKPDVAIDLDSQKETTRNGSEYISGDLASGTQGDLLKRDAAARGMKILSAPDMASVHAIENARTNVENYAQQLLPIIAPDAASRPGNSFKTWMAGLTQAGERGTIAASQAASLLTAIANIRAVGGVSRVTNTEFGIALDGMPDENDTLDVVLTKLANISRQFDTAENALVPLPPVVKAALDKGVTSTKIVDAPYGQTWAIKPDGTVKRIK